MVLLLLIGFLAGVGTAISPCVLPVLPILLAGGAAGGRRRPYAIIAGLVLSFTVFTLAAAWIIDKLGLPDDFLRNAALVLLFVVAATLLVPRLGELLERPFLPLTRRRPAGSGGGFVLGLSLGLVFVPCAGPIFSYVAVRAGSEHLNSKAVLLIVAYSLGAAVPMLLVALGGREISSKLRGPLVRPALGVVMALAGIAIVFNLDTKAQTALGGYTNTIQGWFERTDYVKRHLTGRSRSPRSAARSCWSTSGRTPASTACARSPTSRRGIGPTARTASSSSASIRRSSRSSTRCRTCGRRRGALASVTRSRSTTTTRPGTRTRTSTGPPSTSSTGAATSGTTTSARASTAGRSS